MTPEQAIATALGAVVSRGFRTRLYRTLTDDIAPGLDESTYPVLSAIARHGGGATAGELAAEVGTDRSVVSRRAAALVAADLVTSGRGTDARRVHYSLTTPGQQAVAVMRTRLEETIAEHLHEWTDHDRTEFARLFEEFSRRPL